jgi:hypothetical protein
MAILLQDASSGGGGGQAIATALTTAVSANCTGWGTGGGVTQDITVTATGQTITIPAIAAGDIAPVAKRITLANVGTNAFTVALSGGTITSSVGLTMNPGSVWTFEAKTLTGCTIVTSNASQGVVPEFGEQQIAQTGGLAKTTTFSSILGTTFTIPSAGSWDVSYDICLTTFTGGLGETGWQTRLFNVTANAPVANSLSNGSQDDAAGGTGQPRRFGRRIMGVTTTGSTQFRLEVIFPNTTNNYTVSGNGALAESGKISWNKVSGQVPVTGQSVQRATTALTTLTNGAPAANTWADINPITFTVPANIDVDLSYQIGVLKATAGLVNFRLFDVTGNAAVAGSLGTSQHETANFEGGTVRVTVQVPALSVAKTYKVQFQTNNGGTVSIGAGTSPNISYTQAGSTATVGSASSALRTYPFTDTMALGEPVEIYNNAGTPSVRKCVQGVAGWGASGNPATIAMNNGNQRIAVVLNANNSISTVNLANSSTTTGDVSSAAYANGTYSQSSAAFSTVIASLLASGENVDFLRATSNRDAATPRVCFWTRGAVNGGRFGIFNVNALGAFSSSYLSPTVNQLPTSTTDFDITASGDPNAFLVIANSNTTAGLYRLGNIGLSNFVALQPATTTGNTVTAIKYVDTNGTTTRFVYAYQSSASNTIRMGIGTYNTSTGAITVVGESDTALPAANVVLRSFGLIGTASPTSDITVGLINNSAAVQIVRLNASTGASTLQGSASSPFSGSTIPSTGQVIAHMVPSAFKFVVGIVDNVATNGFLVRECVWDPIGLVMSYPAAAVPYSRTTLGVVENNPFAMPFSKDNPGTGVFAMTDARAGDTSGGPLGTKVVGNTFGTVAVGNYSGLAAEAGTAGQTKNIMLPSGIVAGLTGLTPGQKLYVDSTTNVLTTTNTGVIAAQALSATEVQVRS